MFESTGWILEEPKVPDNTKFDLLVPTVVRPSNDDSAVSSAILFYVIIISKQMYLCFLIIVGS